MQRVLFGVPSDSSFVVSCLSPRLGVWHDYFEILWWWFSKEKKLYYDDEEIIPFLDIIDRLSYFELKDYIKDVGNYIEH